MSQKLGAAVLTAGASGAAVTATAFGIAAPAPSVGHAAAFVACCTAGTCGLSWALGFAAVVGWQAGREFALRHGLTGACRHQRPSPLPRAYRPQQPPGRHAVPDNPFTPDAALPAPAPEDTPAQRTPTMPAVSAVDAESPAPDGDLADELLLTADAWRQQVPADVR